MSETAETPNSSPTSEKESTGSPPSPPSEDSGSGNLTAALGTSLETDRDGPPTAPSPTSDNSNASSPPPEQSTPSEEKSSPPPEPDPPSPPPPATPKPTPPASKPPPSPPQQQTPTPSPPKQQSPQQQQTPTPSQPSPSSTPTTPTPVPSGQSSSPSTPQSPPSDSSSSPTTSDNSSGSSPSSSSSSSSSSSRSPPSNEAETQPRLQTQSTSSETSSSPNSASNTPLNSFSPPSINGTTTTTTTTPTTSLSPPISQALSPPSSISQAGNTNPNSNSNNSGGSSHSHNNLNLQVPIISGTLAGVVIIAFLLCFFFIRSRKKKPPPKYIPPPANFTVTTDGNRGMEAAANANNKNSPMQGNGYGSPGQQTNYRGTPDSGMNIGGSKAVFSYEELMEMTNGFSRQNVIGEGGFGCVYKGWMGDGRAVAVKQLKAGSGQGEREFRAEVEIISRVHHRHLVSLVGYCVSENQRLLIYDFVPNNTLEHHLHGKGLPVLDWVKRAKIAIGAAKGLAYLHEDCHPKIIHRDIKSANILLEADFEAQVADFGLARLNDTTQSHVSTRVMGTFGYLAPEYASSGKLTDRSDVFSFGVVLLELITGRKPVDSTRPLGDESLVEWARPILVNALETGDFSQLVDPRLEKRYVESEMFRMIEAAAACVRHCAAKRPRMAVVVRTLDFHEDSDITNGVKIGQSTAYDSSQYNSEEISKFRKLAWDSDNSSECETYSSQPNSRKTSRYSSGEFTSGESETKAFKPTTDEHI